MHRFDNYMSIRSNYFFGNLFEDKDEVSFEKWTRNFHLLELRFKEAVELLPEREKALFLQYANSPHAINLNVTPFFGSEPNQNYAILLVNRSICIVTDYLKRFGFTVRIPKLAFVAQCEEEEPEAEPEDIIIVPEDPLLPYREKAKRININPQILYDLDHLKPRVPDAASLSEKELYLRVKKLCEENDLPEQLEFYLLSSVAEYLRVGTCQPVLLVGKPGIGKTYFGKVYAEILGLHYYKISAPGASCGRGLTGDSPTFKAARYGEIINAQLQAKATNPVILVDEVDKCTVMGAHHQLNDELLSCLDGTRTIRDHFFETDVNTSAIPFILTANEMRYVPAWLKDRCAIVDFPDPSVKRIASITSKQFEKIKGNALYLNRISVDRQAFDDIITSLRNRGVVSLRQYDSIIKNAAKAAYIEMLETNAKSAIITSRHFAKVMSLTSRSEGKRRIGFGVE